MFKNGTNVQAARTVGRGHQQPQTVIWKSFRSAIMAVFEESSRELKGPGLWEGGAAMTNSAKKNPTSDTMLQLDRSWVSDVRRILLREGPRYWPRD